MDNTLKELESLSEGVNKSDNARLVKQAQVQKDNVDWFQNEVHVKGNPLIDPGAGHAVIIRDFEFKRNPEFKGSLTKQDLFNMHWRQISNILWGDGLIPLENINPRVELTKDGYQIFVTCKPRMGTFVAEKPQTIQSLLTKKRKRK